MKDKQIMLVQESWKLAMYDEDEFINLVYDNLFEISPESRQLFKRNLKMQSKKIMNMFGSVIEKLDRLELVMPDLIPAGRRHKDYGVDSKNFEDFRIALLRALKTVLKNEYSSELEEAWNVVYRFISSTMCSAMRLRD